MNLEAGAESADTSEPKTARKEPLLREGVEDEFSSSEDTMNTDQMDECRSQFEEQLEISKVSDQNDIESEEFSEDDESEDEEMDESEIDFMLEQGLPKSKRLDKKDEDGEVDKISTVVKTNNSELTIKKIVVLDEKVGNTFEVLPGGWIQVRHSSGMPLYLHRKTRVCTLGKPYYLGPASVRRHSIPLSGIPCLAYRRALEKERQDKEMLEKQAKEHEQQQQDEEPVDKSQNNMLLLCKTLQQGALETDKKLSVASSETIAEKLKLFKRKIGIEKEGSEGCKSPKLVPCSQQDIPSQDNKLNEVEQSTEQSEVFSISLPNQSSTEAHTSLSPNTQDSPLKEPETEEKELTAEAKSSSEPVADSSGKEQSCGAPKNNSIRQANSINRTLIPLAKVETARENASLYSVSPLDLRDYCKSLFRFQEVECKRFKTWSARRRHTKEQKRRQLERPTLPDNAQVIKFFDLNAKGDEHLKKFNDYVFNPHGKSSVCILHEFVQHALRKQPTYKFQELENAATPYAAIVMINDVPYGTGLGSSKKTAKAEAAKATLEILIPQMKVQLNGSKTDTNSDFDITEYFQQVEMNDVRIPKMCTSVSEPSPYTLLLTCLQRNFGQSGSNNVKFEMVPVSPSKGNPPNQFRMTANDNEVKVTASNKREGKQLASQLLLAKMHPHITNFGAFIKLYGNGSIKSVKEKKQEEQQITTLQSKASANSPNWAILNKLREEMMKLAEHEKELRSFPISLPSLRTDDKASPQTSDVGRATELMDSA